VPVKLERRGHAGPARRHLLESPQFIKVFLATQRRNCVG
jgi:hypothetical protein